MRGVDEEAEMAPTLLGENRLLSEEKAGYIGKERREWEEAACPQQTAARAFSASLSPRPACMGAWG